MACCLCFQVLRVRQWVPSGSRKTTLQISKKGILLPLFTRGNKSLHLLHHNQCEAVPTTDFVEASLHYAVTPALYGQTSTLSRTVIYQRALVRSVWQVMFARSSNVSVACLACCICLLNQTRKSRKLSPHALGMSALRVVCPLLPLLPPTPSLPTNHDVLLCFEVLVGPLSYRCILFSHRHIRTKCYISARMSTGFVSSAESVEVEGNGMATYRRHEMGQRPIEYWRIKHLPAPTVLSPHDSLAVHQPAIAHIDPRSVVRIEAYLNLPWSGTSPESCLPPRLNQTIQRYVLRVGPYKVPSDCLPVLYHTNDQGLRQSTL